MADMLSVIVFAALLASMSAGKPIPEPQNITPTSCGGTVYPNCETKGTKWSTFNGKKMLVSAYTTAGPDGGTVTATDSRTVGWTISGGIDIGTSSDSLVDNVIPSAGLSITVAYTDTTTSGSSNGINCRPNSRCAMVWQPEMLRVDFERKCDGAGFGACGNAQYHVDLPQSMEMGSRLPKGNFFVCYEKPLPGEESCDDAASD